MSGPKPTRPCVTCGVFVSISADGTLHRKHVCRPREEHVRSEDYRRGYWTGYKAGQLAVRKLREAQS